ncbi:MAG: LysM peptidoglycan-binding domain-containing protein [Anaerolineae bacterium]|nr:LysM peptidoglycan-binding domain-containing protein [Anaerolineae bacterium]
MRRILVLSSVLVVLALLLIPVTAMVSAAPAQQTTTYVVQWGDTMYSIAVRFNTTVQAIAQANNISNPNLIFAGQTLIIPTGGTVPPTTPPSTPGGTVIYTVQPGDYLAKIARQFNTTVSAILSVNNIPNPNLIYPGQQLVIPTGGTTPPPATSMPATPPPQATSVPATPPPGGQTTYVVQPGDTLSSIARRFGTTTSAIAQANGIVNPNLIFVGQVLIIPTGGTAPQPTAIPGQPTVPPPNPGSGFELGGQTFNFAHPNEMRQSGMRWAKIQVRYNLGNPPSIAQGAIDTAHSQGFKVLLSVLGDPGQLGANPGSYYSQFASFLGGVAALGPDAIEVWNEQNIDREWPVGQISPSAYTQMLSQAYTAIKIANPNVLVISGAPAPTGFFGGACTGNGCDDKPFIQGMAAAGAANYADCIGVHYNEGIVPPNQTSGDPRGNPNHYTRYFPTMVNTYAQVFPNKLLCFTELGYLSPEGFGAPPPGFEWSANTSVQEQAEWLAQAAVLSRQSGRIRIMVVWNVDSTVWGADPQAGYAIIRPNNSCLACQTLGSVMGTS